MWISPYFRDTIHIHVATDNVNLTLGVEEWVGCDGMCAMDGQALLHIYAL